MSDSSFPFACPFAQLSVSSCVNSAACFFCSFKALLLWLLSSVHGSKALKSILCDCSIQIMSILKEDMRALGKREKDGLRRETFICLKCQGLKYCSQGISGSFEPSQELPACPASGILSSESYGLLRMWTFFLFSGFECSLTLLVWRSWFISFKSLNY